MLNTELKVLSYPHPILTSPSVDIDIMGDNRIEYVNFIEKMMEFYRGGGGWGRMVGLAAPQVGKNWNIFIAFNEVFINPVLTPDILRGTSKLKEGCYSLEKNKFDYPTTRYYKVRLKWLDINGEEHSRNFYGSDAQIIQHEYEHLLGKLCVQHDSHDSKEDVSG